jgi:uncharacterized protein YcbX
MTDTVPEARLDALYRYPVKGLSPDPLPEVALSPGQTLPDDRRFALENGPSGFDPAQPGYLPKIRFLMLMRNARLAEYRTRYAAPGRLSIAKDGKDLLAVDLTTAEGRAALEDFCRTHFPDELRGPPRLLEAPGHSFSDVARKVVSIINLDSVRALEPLAGGAVDPLRFRGNMHVAGWPAWQEFELLGRRLQIGGATLKVVKRIVRCAAVNVDPATGVRDLDLPASMMRALGHADCGVYAEVVAGGTVAAGDRIVVSA